MNIEPEYVILGVAAALPFAFICFELLEQRLRRKHRERERERERARIEREMREEMECDRADLLRKHREATQRLQMQLQQRRTPESSAAHQEP